MTTAAVKETRKISSIWLIPIVAAVLGIWVVINHFATQGPKITIKFETAEGIEAGKTKIKALNVELGVVTSVELNEAMDGVVIEAQLDPFARSMLREDTALWVERPRVGPGGVSGLGTILSGGFIQLQVGRGKEGRRDFIGRESPPLTPAGMPGLRLVLKSDRASDLSVGDPVLYRGFQVGQVEATRLDLDAREARSEIFIDAPYDALVYQNTRFWNASGFTFVASASGIELDIGSLQSLVTGGVAFGLPDGMVPEAPAEAGAEFRLLKSKARLNDVAYEHGFDVVVAFEQSVSGLQADAAVEYRGIQVGVVRRIMTPELLSDVVTSTLEGDDSVSGRPIPVLIHIEPGRIGLPDTEASSDLFMRILEAGARKGLRADLKMGNLLTGQQVVAIDFFPGVPEATLGEYAGYVAMPSMPGSGSIPRQISEVLAKLNDLPVEPLLEDINETVVSLTGLLQNLQGMPSGENGEVLYGSIGTTLRKLNITLDSIAPDSSSGRNLNRSLAELNLMLRNLEDLGRQLSAKPNSILFSDPIEADPVPRRGDAP